MACQGGKDFGRKRRAAHRARTDRPSWITRHRSGRCLCCWSRQCGDARWCSRSAWGPGLGPAHDAGLSQGLARRGRTDHDACATSPLAAHLIQRRARPLHGDLTLRRAVLSARERFAPRMSRILLTAFVVICPLAFVCLDPKLTYQALASSAPSEGSTAGRADRLDESVVRQIQSGQDPGSASATAPMVRSERRFAQCIRPTDPRQDFGYSGGDWRRPGAVRQFPGR